jgi:hypothetical protein
MKVGSFDLSYCLNAFPARGLRGRLAVLRENLPRVRDALGLPPNTPFAVGLWLDAVTARRLLPDSPGLAALRQALADHHLYVVTINAFPYGRFHGTKVKEAVYRPDWTSPARLSYTLRMAEILAALLPEDAIGSISTVPGSYRAWVRDERTRDRIRRNLLTAGCELRNLERRTGRRIRLGLEMEPDCLWEDPAEFATDYLAHFAGKPGADHLGVCYDTCHQEVIGAAPGEGLRCLAKAGVPIVKVQLSAALAAPTAAARAAVLANFADPVYLHQTRAGNVGPRCLRHADLPNDTAPAVRQGSWTVHYHVPIHGEKLFSGLVVGKAELTATLALLRRHPNWCRHLEIETYTYDVLPPELLCGTREDTIAAEYRWTIAALTEKRQRT